MPNWRSRTAAAIILALVGGLSFAQRFLLVLLVLVFMSSIVLHLVRVT